MQLYIFLFSVLTFLNACDTVKNEVNHEFKLKKRHILPDLIQETSGIIIYNNLVWTFNDSGGRPVIYGFNLLNDSIEQTISLNNGVNEDWEDIAQDESYIYIGDFGNNQGMRDSMVIYRIPKKSIPSKGNASLKAEILVFSYPEYQPVSIPISMSAFDCEAFVSINDSLYLFTKDWTNGTSTVYSLPKKSGRYVARKLVVLNTQGLITGADYHQKRLVLIGYSSFVPFLIQYPADDILKISDKTGIRTDLQEISTYQTEGICFYNDNILISSEKTRSPAQIIELTK